MLGERLSAFPKMFLTWKHAASESEIVYSLYFTTYMICITAGAPAAFTYNIFRYHHSPLMLAVMCMPSFFGTDSHQ